MIIYQVQWFFEGHEEWGTETFPSRAAASRKVKEILADERWCEFGLVKCHRYEVGNTKRDFINFLNGTAKRACELTIGPRGLLPEQDRD